MPSDDKQRRAFEFLQEQFRSQGAFTKEAMQRATTWNRSSFETYWGKQFKPFVVAVAPVGSRVTSTERLYRVSDAFRLYASWERFRQHVTQVRHFSADYRSLRYEHVLIYEFYMPLTNEPALRMTLDALFYKDTVKARLRVLETGALKIIFPANEKENEEEYFDRICGWIAKRFVGYSISHVSGRFRAADLTSMAEAADLQERGGRYLIDETTAVVRFIFPCDGDEKLIWWFFKELFVESIIHVVNGEAEIWMVESGMVNRLHIWRVEN